MVQKGIVWTRIAKGMESWRILLSAVDEHSLECNILTHNEIKSNLILASML